MIRSVSFIGAGNVATILANNLSSRKIQIIDICSASIDNASVLSARVGANSIDDIKKLNQQVDLLVIAVNDDAISKLIHEIKIEVPIVHTSGSMDMSVLSKFKTHGILYPFQTLSKSRIIDTTDIPFLIETNSADFKETLQIFANRFSDHVFYMTSDMRSKIHLTGVLTSNFTIQLMIEAEKILNTENIPIDILKPLVTETVKKAFEIGPDNALTGPAKRGDMEILAKQQKMIADEKLARIYQLMSELILSKNNQ